MIGDPGRAVSGTPFFLFTLCLHFVIWNHVCWEIKKNTRLMGQGKAYAGRRIRAGRHKTGGKIFCDMQNLFPFRDVLYV